MLFLEAVQEHQYLFSNADIAWVLTFVLAIGNVINLFAVWIRNAKLKVTAPEKLQNEKIAELADRVDELQAELKENDAKYAGLIKHYEGTRDRHDRTIASLTEGQVVVLESIKSLVDHERHGGDEGLEESSKKLDAFIYKSLQRQKGNEE